MVMLCFAGCCMQVLSAGAQARQISSQAPQKDGISASDRSLSSKWGCCCCLVALSAVGHPVAASVHRPADVTINTRSARPLAHSTPARPAHQRPADRAVDPKQRPSRQPSHASYLRSPAHPTPDAIRRRTTQPPPVPAAATSQPLVRQKVFRSPLSGFEGGRNKKDGRTPAVKCLRH